MTAELDGTEHQPHARMVLGNALKSLESDSDAGRSMLSHAYIFQGPQGAGKRDVAKSFATAILGAGKPGSSDVNRRVVADTHPDLAWVGPRGAHGILVSDIRERVVAAIWRRPFEAERSVYVIEQAELMNQEAANALLKTLEEPPPYAHLILTSSVPGRLPETVRSRCQPVRFGPLPVEVISGMLIAEAVPPDKAEACARISAGDAGLARRLASSQGDALREAGKRLVSSAEGPGEGFDRPWLDMLKLAEERGSRAEAAANEEAESVLELYPKGRELQRIKRELEQAAKRQKKREATATLNLQLKLSEYLLHDLVALESGAKGLLINTDLEEWLPRHAKHEIANFISAIEICEQTRRHLRQNVTADLALEALFYRVGAVLS